MSGMVFLVLLTMIFVVGSLVLGIASMVHHGPVGHHSSEQWMSLRVVFQALAVILMVVAFLAAS